MAEITITLKLDSTETVVSNGIPKDHNPSKLTPLGAKPDPKVLSLEERTEPRSTVQNLSTVVPPMPAVEICVRIYDSAIKKIEDEAGAETSPGEGGG